MFGYTGQGVFSNVVRARDVSKDSETRSESPDVQTNVSIKEIFYQNILSKSEKNYKKL